MEEGKKARSMKREDGSQKPDSAAATPRTLGS